MKSNFLKHIWTTALVLFLLIPGLTVSLKTPVFAETLSEYNFVPIYYEGRKTSMEACTIKGNVYMKVDDYLNYAQTSGYELDTDSLKIFFDTENMNLFVADEETSDFIKKNAGICYGTLKSIPKDGHSDVYISLNMMEPFSKLSFTTNGSACSNSEDTDITRVYLSKMDTENMGMIPSGTKGAASIADDNGKNITLEQDGLGKILRETANFYKIETTGGDILYINKEDFEPFTEESPIPDYIYFARKKTAFDGKFNLVWQQISGTGITPLPPDETGGIDVIAPMWYYQQVNSDGNISNYGDRGYTDLAHERGFEVWATFKNNVSDNATWQNYTSSVLEDEDLRNKTAAQYLFYASLYDVDGINIDFEYLKNSDRDNLTAFMETLTTYGSNMGIKVSIDTLINESYNKMYDYEVLGEMVDYLCVMTYDNHYNGSMYAGSVSPMDWYTKEVEELLEMMDSEKLVMGIPFYSRLYPVDDRGLNLAKGSSTINVVTAGMSTMRTVVKESGKTPEWLPSAGQYYLEYIGDKDIRKMVWLEDKRSIATRLSYVYHYDLAGSCCWAYGQQEDGIFEVFEDIYKYGISPGAYDEPY